MADIDLQAALDQTIRHHLNGTGLLGIPGYRSVELELNDTLDGPIIGRLICPDHGSLIAVLDQRFMITAEFECRECGYHECTNCDQRHGLPCREHAEDWTDTPLGVAL